MAPTHYPASVRTEVRRLPERGSLERALVHAILDEGVVCHVGFATDEGPVVIPTLYARDGERLYLHGSPASRLLRNLSRGIPLCITVTLIDGLVLARSAFHHSMNYRSAVLFGHARDVGEIEEKRRALGLLVEHVVPGRTPDTRGRDDSARAGRADWIRSPKAARRGAFRDEAAQAPGQEKPKRRTSSAVQRVGRRCWEHCPARRRPGRAIDR